MKKIVVLLSFLICIAGSMTLAAASYENNEYQRKSRAFSNLATKSYDEGAYDKAVEYALQAEENAILSAEFISGMIARSEAEKILFKARTRLTWAREKKAENFSPLLFPLLILLLLLRMCNFLQEIGLKRDRLQN